MSKMIKESDFQDIVAIYNKSGKLKANAFIREKYGVKNPWFTFRRIRESGSYTYDEANDKYVTYGETPDESLFMSIEELCKTPTGKPIAKKETSLSTRGNGMNALIQTLISDRLLELSKYVTLDVESRTIMVDQSGMRSDGYQVFTH